MSTKPGRREALANTLMWLARLILAGVFLAAAAPKLLDPATFATAIANYQAFPDGTVNLIAAVVPALELVGALALLTPWRRGGALLLAGLLLGFTVLLGVSLARGLDLSCGCFGGAAGNSDPVSPLHLLRNVGLLALAGVVLAAPRVVAAPRVR